MSLSPTPVSDTIGRGGKVIIPAFAIGRTQVKEGSHALDVCTAYVGRDETADMVAVTVADEDVGHVRVDGKRGGKLRFGTASAICRRMMAAG